MRQANAVEGTLVAVACSADRAHLATSAVQGRQDAADNRATAEKSASIRPSSKATLRAQAKDAQPVVEGQEMLRCPAQQTANQKPKEETHAPQSGHGWLG
ncbi:hypothetical protein CLCR_09331 [Cladophialophora carrionii]|uniref:Uncharacterized protein n=1 Tax=Cladophialophora carrionii TaxID=86049 RepID=A0A1C1CUE7_9EURO|nr:hypothetical protein CLCR_09331 [Cladophialophora carrionii]